MTAPFERIFAPIGIEEFTRDYFERAPLHVARNDSQRFADLYGVADIEDALQLGAVDNVALVKAGSPPLAREHYAPSRPARQGEPPVPRVDARRVAEAFAQGWTLILNDASLANARLQRFCNALQAQTGWFVQPNAYFTPPGTQGFGVHYDTHGTLVAQIEGAKVWRVYEPPVQLPLESQPFNDALAAVTLRREIVMQPGDTLYVPHGFPHEAVSRNERSLHLTFAMLAPRTIDLLERMLALGGREDPDLRRALPAGWHRDATFAERFTSSMRTHLDAAFAPERVSPASERLLLEFLGTARIDASGAFERANEAGALTPAHVLRIRESEPYAVSPRDGALTLVIPGRSIALPPSCAAALQRLQSGPCAIGELPGLEAAERLAFARALLIYGVVHLASS